MIDISKFLVSDNVSKKEIGRFLKHVVLKSYDISNFCDDVKFKLFPFLNLVSDMKCHGRFDQTRIEKLNTLDISFLKTKDIYNCKQDCDTHEVFFDLLNLYKLCLKNNDDSKIHRLCFLKKSSHFFTEKELLSIYSRYY